MSNQREFFEFRGDDRQYGEWKKGDIGFFLSSTFQDCGPVFWIVLKDKVVGCNPSQIKPQQKLHQSTGPK